MNKKRILSIFIVLLLLGAVVLFTRQPKSNATVPPPVQLDLGLEEDSLEQMLDHTYSALDNVLKMNEDTALNFQVQFRKGHVSKANLAGYLTKNDDGYSINLKNSSPVTTPLVVDNTIYVSGGFGSKQFYSFDMTTGALNWAINLDDDGPSSPTYCDSLLIFNTESCTIFAVNRFTGKMVWSHWLGDPLLSSPLAVNGRVYTSYPDIRMYGGSIFNSYNNVQNNLLNNNPNIVQQQVPQPKPPKKPSSKQYTGKIKPRNPFVCFDAKDGSILWQKWLDSDVMITPIYDDEFIYLTTYSGVVYKLDADKGDIVASVDLNATSLPSIVGNQILITKRSDSAKVVKESIAVLDKNTLALIKEFNAVDAPHLNASIQNNSLSKMEAERLDMYNGFSQGAPATANAQEASKNIGLSNVSSMQLFQPSTVFYAAGKVYNLMGNTIYCSNPKTEEVVWQYTIEGDLEKVGGTLATTPIITANNLITITNKGKVLFLDLITGQINFEKDLEKPVRSAPIASDGKLIIPTTQGELVLLDTNDPTIDNWEMLMKQPNHQPN